MFGRTEQRGIPQHIDKKEKTVEKSSHKKWLRCFWMKSFPGPSVSPLSLFPHQPVIVKLHQSGPVAGNSDTLHRYITLHCYISLSAVITLHRYITLNYVTLRYITTLHYIATLVWLGGNPDNGPTTTEDLCRRHREVPPNTMRLFQLWVLILFVITIHFLVLYQFVPPQRDAAKHIATPPISTKKNLCQHRFGLS